MDNIEALLRNDRFCSQCGGKGYVTERYDDGSGAVTDCWLCKPRPAHIRQGEKDKWT